jgi:hypothetical protein
MRPSSKTVVWIAARPRLRKARAPSIPAMRGDRRSHDLDDASKWMTEIYLQQFRSPSPRSTVGVVPPPELLTPSDLEEFVDIQRFRPLNFLLRVCLLDLVFALVSVISSEL